MRPSILNTLVICAALALDGDRTAPRINPLPTAAPRRPKQHKSWADHGWKGDGVVPERQTRQQQRADVGVSAKRAKKLAQRGAR